ncbi:proline iminopeptidase-family hydrolase [Alteromonas sp. CYL-A6]|uniref:proline iminopeptidase-family hydrolase n=1 Tax=Alteromonas nitratireducens TaxID=3390813 RepID=UPI0034C13775
MHKALPRITLFWALSLLTICSLITTVKAATAPFGEPEKEMMVEVEGGKVYVRLNGLAHNDKAPVIFIHGGPGGTHNYFAGMLPLANARTVIMYDQLDSGKSEQPNDPKNWRVARFVASLETIRKAVGAQRWHVVGHSWGSALALEYTARYPDRVVSTVLGGTFISAPQWVMDANILVKQAPAAVQQTLMQCESETPPADDVCEKAYITLYSQHYERPAKSEARKAYDKRMGGNGFNPVIYTSMWGPSEFSSTGILKTYDATALLKQINPGTTLFMIGQYDSARIDTVQNYLTLTPGAELAVIPGASHGLYSDRPVAVEGVLRGWLARHDR